MEETQLSEKLEELTKKYGAPSKSEREHVSNIFETDRGKEVRKLRRISAQPDLKEAPSIGDIHRDMAEIQLDLAELAETYGKLNVNLQTVFGKDGIYGAKDLTGIAIYSVLMNKGKVRNIKLDAIKRRGDAIDYIVNKMAEVLETQHQKTIQGRTQAERIKLDSVSDMKRLDRKLIECLKSSKYSDVDYETAQAEIEKIENEVKEIDDVLKNYETGIQNAKAEKNLEKVAQLSAEMAQVLDMKYKVIDGELAAEGVVSEIRRYILDSAEGVQSAKGALAATRVNYQVALALEDSLNELEIKYKHALEDMIPVFKGQAKLAQVGTQALDVRDTLVKVAEKSQKLMEVNEKIVTRLAIETFDLLKTPIYDVKKARAIELRIQDYMTQLNENKMSWAEQQSTITDTAGPHYAVRK